MAGPSVVELVGPPGDEESELLCAVNEAAGHNWIQALPPGDVAHARTLLAGPWWIRFGVRDHTDRLVAHAGVRPSTEQPAGVPEGASEFCRAMVRVDHRGLGFARALSDAALSWAAAAGSPLWLRALDPGEAWRVWESCGWVVVGGAPSPRSGRWLHHMVPADRRW